MVRRKELNTRSSRERGPDQGAGCERESKSKSEVRISERQGMSKGSQRAHIERERDDTEYAHDEEHATFILFGSLEVGSSTMGASADTTVVECAGAEELDGEEQRFLELVVDLARLHRGVEGRSVWCVLVSRSEESASEGGSVRGSPDEGPATYTRSSRNLQSVLATISSFFSSSLSPFLGTMVRCASPLVEVPPRQSERSMVDDYG